MANVGGPLRLPRVRNDPNAFLGYQHIEDHATTAQSGLVPTPAERAGDFSQSVNLAGRPVQLVDPATGQPFASNRIPVGRLSPQALSLLNYYPLPNADRPPASTTRCRSSSARGKTVCRPACRRWSTPGNN